MGTLTITPHYGTHWSGFSNPTAATACITRLCNDIAGLFAPTTSKTVDIDFDFGYCQLSPVSGGAESAYYTTGISYSSFKSAITNATNFPLDAARTTAYVSLPSSDPSSNFGGGGMEVTEACAYILGLASAPGDGTHFVGFGSSEPWDLTVDGSTCASGYVSLYSEALHEVTECLGRSSALGWGHSTFTVLDLLRFTANNTRTYTANGYCSFDNGATNIRNWDFNNPTVYDAQDWDNYTPFNRSGILTSPFNGIETYSTVELLQPEDLQLLSVMGLTLSTTGAALAYSNIGTAAGTGAAIGIGASTAAAVGSAPGTGAAIAIGTSMAAAIAAAAGLGAGAGASSAPVTHGIPSWAH